MEYRDNLATDTHRGGLRRRRVKNAVFLAFVVASSLIVLSPLFFVITSVVTHGISSIDLDLFIQLPRPVGESGGGILHALLGTLCLVAGALAISVPMAIPAGVFMASDTFPKIAFATRLAADVLAGVPSIVIGIFAYSVLVVPLRHFSGLAGMFALAIIMLPTIARTTEEVVRMVPSTYIEAAVALGAPRWRVVMQVVLPTASRGVAAGVIAATARAAGETAPLMFTAFGSQFINFNPMHPTAAVPLVIFNYAISPYEEWHELAWAAALVLITMVLAANLFSRWLISRKAA